MNQAVASKIIKQKWEKSDVSVLIENSVDENNNEEYVNTIYLYSQLDFIYAIIFMGGSNL